MSHKESFLQYLQTEKRYSPHTVRSYSNDLDQFCLFLSEQGLPEDPVLVNSHDIRAWIVSMLDNNYTTVSVHRKISCLRVFYRYLRKERYLSNDPLEKVVLPKRKKRLPVFVEESAMNTLLDDCTFGESDRRLLPRIRSDMGGYPTKISTMAGAVVLFRSLAKVVQSSVGSRLYWY